MGKKRIVRRSDYDAEFKKLQVSLQKKIDERFTEHFKACPWCGKEPYLRVALMPVLRSNGLFTYESDRELPEEYRLELWGCDHMSHEGGEGIIECLNTYPVDTIPEEPTFPNPEFTWYGEWNGDGITSIDVPFENFPCLWDDELHGYRDAKGNTYSKKKSLSQWTYHCMSEWKFQNGNCDKCCICGAKWRNIYEQDANLPSIDGVRYCLSCAEKKFGLTGGNTVPGIIYDMRNISSMWDGEGMYYTSLAEFERCTGDRIHHVKRIRNGSSKRADSLTGTILGDRYEIYSAFGNKSHFSGFIWEPVPECDRARYKELVSKEVKR